MPRKEGRDIGTLGDDHKLALFILRGGEARKFAIKDFLASFIRGLVDRLDMEPAGDPRICEYPLNDGKGGVGYTIFQPITTSYLQLSIVIDTWPELRGGTLLIHSCKWFETHLIQVYLAKTFGAQVQAADICFDLINERPLIWREYG